MDALPLLLALTVAFAMALYVVLDGFDLGIGILFTLAPSDEDRDAMMNAIGPVWDGNETWLVMGGTVLFAAFPAAYATLLPRLYLPLMAMLLGLVFRGVAFEFRFRAARFRKTWDWSFALGSALASLMQGIMLGLFINGFSETRQASALALGGFVIASGLGVTAFYAQLGAAWLILKTEGTTQAFARRAMRWTLPLVLLFVALISIFTPLTHPSIAMRWFSLPNFFYLSPVPLLTAIFAFGIWRAISERRESLPYLFSVGLFLMAYLGLGVSLWPYAVPETLTIWQAASSPPTLVAVGIGVAITLPVILAYLAYSHWVFRGKTPTGYEH
jgi:cytochrome d ubiquinol oxidase subunit II